METKEQLTRAKFNALKRYYDQTWDSKNHTLHVGYFGYGAKTLGRSYNDATRYLESNLVKCKAIDRSSNILDIGCGTGRTLFLLAEKYGCSGMGIDLSDEQIKDAKAELRKINADRKTRGMAALKIRFLRGSGSSLGKLLPVSGVFSHILSQDALLFVEDKKSLFRNMQRLLSNGGAIGIADFLAQSPKKKFSADARRSVYRMLNWNKDLSFSSYLRSFKSVGLKVVKSEERGMDMIKTYRLLARDMRRHLRRDDATYEQLMGRYSDIVKSVKNGKMGWGLFFAVKQ